MSDSRRVRGHLATVWRVVNQRRSRQVLSALLALVLVAGLVRVITLAVVEDPPVPGAQKERAVAGGSVRPGKPPAAAPTGRPFTARAPVWPPAGSAEADLAAGGTVRVPGTPVSLAAAGADAPTKVR